MKINFSLMSMDRIHIIELHRVLPAKPSYGAVCNGCGLCCLTETCPVARAWLWQWKGACKALEWNDDLQRYFCGMVHSPSRYLRWLPRGLAHWMRPVFARWISVESGCDADYEEIN